MIEDQETILNGKELTAYKIGVLCKSVEEIHVKLDKFILDVNSIGIKTDSVQNELKEHKSNHYFWIGLLFGSGILFVIGAWVLK